VPRSNTELWLAFFSMLVIGSIYSYVVLAASSIPPAKDLFGHTIGIIGFILMIMTEILYSLRKRTRSANWGKMATWLKFHIYTGLVGPFMVLLHSSWKFNGLAGIVMLLTVLIVISGFIGRYIYTAVPRTLDGVEFEAQVLQSQIAQVEAGMKNWVSSQSNETRQAGLRMVSVPDYDTNGVFSIFGRIFTDLAFRVRAWSELRSYKAAQRIQLRQFEQLVRQRRALNRQISSVATARKLLSLWHTIHIPIGIALFTTATIHVIAAVYYATLLH
jgi:hypothetical protein